MNKIIRKSTVTFAILLAATTVAVSGPLSLSAQAPRASASLTSTRPAATVPKPPPATSSAQATETAAPQASHQLRRWIITAGVAVAAAIVTGVIVYRRRPRFCSSGCLAGQP